jgi:hypothetical protein
MTPDHDDLGPALADQTRWNGDSPDLWRKALDAADARPTAWLRIGSRPMLAACITIVACGLLIAAMVPSLQSVRGRRPAPPASALRSMPESPQLQYPTEPVNRGRVSGYAELSEGRDPSPRLVARKATIELESPDIRGTCAKAAHLASEALGEFVEQSEVTGDGPRMRGSLTLRISAQRLSTVLASLRELGVVKSESSGGEDVTDQVVDLEARLRNEQKIEQELLKLVETRADAPLKEVLELRQSLASVRESIERLTGQRDRLSRLVSLASILVIIRSPDQPAAEPKADILSYFTDSVAKSWRRGLESLASSAAALVGIAVGGLIWWAILAIAIVALLRWRTRAIMRGT